MYSLEFSEKFFDDVKRHKKSGHKKLLTKIESLLLECMESPKEGTGHPEQLKFHSEETWSRRIDQKYRLVYKIDATEETPKIFVLSVYGHYDDK